MLLGLIFKYFVISLLLIKIEKMPLTQPPNPPEGKMVGRGRKERWADVILRLKKGDFSFQTGSGLLIPSSGSAHLINHESS